VKPSVGQNIASLTNSFVNMGGSLSNAFAALIPKARAADKPYDWGFPDYDIPLSVLKDKDLENPYANADKVAALLDGNGGSGSDIAEKAKTCFGTHIEKVDDMWDITQTDPVNPNSDEYSSANCDDISDVNWKRMILFVSDTKNMKAVACYQGDDEACADLGLKAPTASEAATSTASATIDMDSLFKKSSDIACAPGTKDLGEQDGYTQGNKVKIKICAIPGFPSTGEESGGGYGVSGADGNVVVNSRVSGAVLAMVEAAKKDGVSLAAISSFRTMAHQRSLCPCDGVSVAVPGTSNHQMGLAIDFGGGLPSSPGPIPGNKFWNWLSKNAGDFGYKNYPREAWHWSPTGS
jgi:hypothetical protein